MKKILVFTMLFLLVFTVACGSNEENTSGSKQGGEATEKDTAETKTALLEFQEKVVDVLKDQNRPFATFESSKAIANDPEAAAEEKPTEEELQSLLETAKKAGPKAAEAIRAIEVPADLEQYKDEIDAALEDAAKSYEKRAESLTVEADADAQKEAEELFASFEKKMGKVFEDLGLLAPSFSKELQ